MLSRRDLLSRESRLHGLPLLRPARFILVLSGRSGGFPRPDADERKSCFGEFSRVCVLYSSVRWLGFLCPAIGDSETPSRPSFVFASAARGFHASGAVRVKAVSGRHRAGNGVTKL